MTSDTLKQQHEEFHEEILLDAENSGELQATSFFNKYARIAEENGDCSDLECSHVRKDGVSGYQIDGYSFGRDELVIVISDFHSSGQLQNLHLADLNALFRKGERFLQNALQGKFVAQLEETSAAFQVAHLIHENAASITDVKFMIFSNALLATRKKTIETKTVGGQNCKYSILDFSRYVDIVTSRTGSEPIDIDIKELHGSTIPCIKAFSGQGEYESYLIVLPGTLLARIYGDYGARLLEQNVRTFLQARTKVNKGIINTINDHPGMFFAYNNGLTATASKITTASLPDGGQGLAGISDLQIVNGGQTTASILYAKDRNKSDLSSVYIQMKLTVVKPEMIEKVVPKISRFANTQNRISEADFFASHPFHIEMEKISQRTIAPAKEGVLHGSRWFYERARGQYKNQQAYMSEAGRKRFLLEYPKDQLIVKTDVAKYELTFERRPHRVSQGAQKAFLFFADSMAKRWETEAKKLGEGYFKNIVAKAIVFRGTDKMIGSSDWYRNNRGHKAPIVTYTIAWVIDEIRQKLAAELDLRQIWSRQSIPAVLENLLWKVALQVSGVIKDAPEKIRNIAEYAKSESCWKAVQEQVEVPLPDDIENYVLDAKDIKEIQQGDKNVKKIDDDIDLDTRILKLVPHMKFVREAAARNDFLSPSADRVTKKLLTGWKNLTKPDKRVISQLLVELEDAGIDIPE